MDNAQAEKWIKNLGLEAHPEGGYFRETFRAEGEIDSKALPEKYGASRKYYTSIYFLLKGKEVSHLHRIKSDEIWAFHAGGALNIHVISPDGNYEVLKLGLNVENDEKPQQIVKAGSWFGATLSNGSAYSLVGCMVAPGFDFADFELAKRKELIALYPDYQNIIMELTANN